MTDRAPHPAAGEDVEAGQPDAFFLERLAQLRAAQADGSLVAGAWTRDRFLQEIAQIERQRIRRA
jgi:hypothetical protein